MPATASAALKSGALCLNTSFASAKRVEFRQTLSNDLLWDKRGNDTRLARIAHDVKTCKRKRTR